MDWLKDLLKALAAFAVLIVVLNVLSYLFDWPVWFLLPFDW